MLFAPLVLSAAVTLADPPELAELHNRARTLPSQAALAGPAGLSLLKAFDEAGRPQAYIASWKEGPALNDALARAASFRGLESMAAAFRKSSGKGFPPLPAAAAVLPDQGPLALAGPVRRVVMAWPFTQDGFQASRLLGTALDQLRPRGGDVLVGRRFRLVASGEDGRFDLGALANPWHGEGVLASFSFYAPRTAGLKLRLESEGEAKILIGEGSFRGWKSFLIYARPPGAGPLGPGQDWSLKLSLLEPTPGLLFAETAPEEGDELSGYLAWVSGTGVSKGEAQPGGFPSPTPSGPPGPRKKKSKPSPPTEVLAWARPWIEKGFERPIQVRNRKGESLDALCDGVWDSVLALPRGETWLVLDLGEARLPSFVLLLMDRPALSSAVVEASKDGGHYALLGEFRNLSLQSPVLLSPEPGESCRLLRLVLTAAEEGASLREVLVSYTRPSP